MGANRELGDQQLFNTISRKYSEKDIYPLSRKARAFQVKCMIDFISKEYEVRRLTSMIEVGCGHGANSDYLKSLYENYLGVDYSEELIEIASKRYGDTRTKFVVDNIKEVDKYGKFDLVVGIGILHHVDDINKTLEKLKEIGHEKTLYIFYEPQRGNPVIQILRKLRVKIDSSYSGEQIFFEKNELKDTVARAGFKNIQTRFNGYFTPPFAQVIIKPAFLFQPLVKMAIGMDQYLFSRVNSRLAWNFMIAFTK